MSLRWKQEEAKAPLPADRAAQLARIVLLAKEVYGQLMDMGHPPECLRLLGDALRDLERP